MGITPASLLTASKHKEQEMRKAKLMGLAVLALFAVAAFTASAAFAEEDVNSPQLLVLSGSVTELKGTFAAKEGSAMEFVPLSGTNIITARASTSELKNCKEESTSKLDTTLCQDVPGDSTGVKDGSTACRSENSKGEKDPVETVLGLGDSHLSAEESLQEGETMKLEPLLLGKVLGTALEEPLIFNCALLKVQVKGDMACLLSPGLTNVAAGGTLETVCSVGSTDDPVTGHCEVLCEDFGKTVGIEVSFNGGKTFEDAWGLGSASGTLNKDVYIDD